MSDPTVIAQVQGPREERLALLFLLNCWDNLKAEERHRFIETGDLLDTETGHRIYNAVKLLLREETKKP